MLRPFLLLPRQRGWAGQYAQRQRSSRQGLSWIVHAHCRSITCTKMQRREDAVHAVPADHLYSRCPTPAKCASSLDSSIRSGLWWFAALTYSVCILGRSKSSIFEWPPINVRLCPWFRVLPQPCHFYPGGRLAEERDLRHLRLLPLCFAL